MKLQVFKPIQVFSFWFTWMSRDIRHVSIISHRDCVWKEKRRSFKNSLDGCRSEWLKDCVTGICIVKHLSVTLKHKAAIKWSATVFTWVAVRYSRVDHSCVCCVGADERKTNSWGHIELEHVYNQYIKLRFILYSCVNICQSKRKHELPITFI